MTRLEHLCFDGLLACCASLLAPRRPRRLAAVVFLTGITGGLLPAQEGRPNRSSQANGQTNGQLGGQPNGQPKGQANGQPNRSRRFGPNDCGPADPTYLRMANETGGLPMFLQRSEAGKAVQLMRESTGENRVTLLWATGKLSGATREFTVPLDATVERATFSLSTDTKGTSLIVTRPAGEAVAAGGAGVEDTDLNCGRVVTVASPEAGPWRVQVTGSGRYWIEVEGKSEIFFVTVQFVRLGGRPGHEGYFRIPGQPLGGEPAMLEAGLSRSAGRPAFELVTEAGETIGTIPIHPEPDGDPSEYYGRFQLPDQPFRVAVRGHDEKGNEYQRYFHTLFHAENVEVIPHFSALDELPAGKTTTLNYTVRNVGPAASFRILAFDGRHYLTRVEPRELTLETGASASLAVDLTLPAAVPPGTGLDLTVTATSTSGPATSNGSSQHLSVVAAAAETGAAQP